MSGVRVSAALLVKRWLLSGRITDAQAGVLLQLTCSGSSRRLRGGVFVAAFLGDHTRDSIVTRLNRRPSECGRARWRCRRGGWPGPAASHAARRVCQTWPIRSARGNWGPARPARLRRRGIRGSRCPGPPSRAVRRRKPRRSRAPARRLLKARSDISRHSRHWRPTGLPPIHRMNRRTPRHQFTIWNRTLDDGARTCR